MTLRFLIAALLFPCAVLAQTRVTIPVQDPVYRDIDRLIALRLVEVGLYGQRPYSRREIARISREAGSKLDSADVSTATRRIVERLTTRFATEVAQLEKRDTVRRDWRLGATWELVALSSPSRAIATDAVGSVDALIDPIRKDRGGREYFDRLSVSAEPTIDVYPNERLGFRFQPRGVKQVSLDSVVSGRVEGASVTTAIRNVTIELGRQPVVWGQGMEGGLLFSSSGRSMDMVRISTDLPFRGWFIKGTSPMRGSIIAAHMGRGQYFPNSFLVAYKLSGHPFTNRVELAASVLGVQGGRGAPRGTFVDHAMDLIPIFKYLLPDNTAQFSNKMAGWEYRVRIPEWSGLQLYAEHAFEDMDPRRWGSTFWEDGGHIIGASMVDLGPSGALSGAMEFHHTGLRFYKHGVFLSGMAVEQTLVGDPLGNQGDAGYIRLGWDRGGTRRLTLDAAIERRDGDSYRTLSDGPDEDNFRFEMYQSVPAEWRYRLMSALQWDNDGRWGLNAGVERVRNFGFVAGSSRTNFLIGASLTGEGSSRRHRP